MSDDDDDPWTRPIQNNFVVKELALKDLSQDRLFCSKQAQLVSLVLKLKMSYLLLQILMVLIIGLVLCEHTGMQFCN